MLQVSADPIGVSAHHVPEEVEPVGEHIQLTVNGTARELDVEPRRLLVQALREISTSPAPTSAATPASAAPALSMSTVTR